jgi:hypothetical protein
LKIIIIKYLKKKLEKIKEENGFIFQTREKIILRVIGLASIDKISRLRNASISSFVNKTYPLEIIS